MRITRLEIFGFKSFVERFVLNFDRPLIGIVGPNGCGKSNVVDALRWVLGETHAKQLRGSLLEDVIFNGSDARRPLGMAEVSITLKPDTHWSENGEDSGITLEELISLNDSVESNGHTNGETTEHTGDEEEEKSLRPVDLSNLAQVVPGIFDASEVQVTRRLYRSGESEYFINRVPCRLRDLSDLYRVIGMGPRGLSIVQQGQISEIITRKPIERRQLLEEAAGISGFRMRMEAATRQLERTTVNIARLTDIIQEVEKQVTSLRRQAKRAEARESLKAQQLSIETKLFRGKAKALLIERKTAITEQESLRAEIDFLANELLSRSAAEQESRANIEQVDDQLGDLRRSKERIQTELQAEAERRNRLRLQLAEAEGQIRTITERLAAADERKAAIGLEIERRRGIVEQAAERRAGFRTAREQLEADNVEANNTELNELSNQIFEKRTAVTSRRRNEHELLLNRAALESEIRALETQVETLAQIFRSDEDTTEVEQITAKLQQFGAHALIGGLNVPEELALAVTAVLGDKMRALVTDQADEMFSSLEGTLRESQIALAVLKRTPVAGLEDALHSFRRYAQEWFGSRGEQPSFLLEKIVIGSEYRGVAERLLGFSIILENTADAQAFLAGCPTELRTLANVVTARGEVFTAEGWRVTANQGATALSTSLSVPRRLVEARAQQSTVAEQLTGLTSEISELDSALSHLEERRSQLEASEVRRKHEEINKVTAELATVEGLIRFENERLEELRSELHHLDSRSKSLLDQQRNLNAQLAEFRNSVSTEGDAQQAGANAREELHSFELQISQLEARRSEVRLQLAEAAQAAEEFRRRRDTLQSQSMQATLSAERLQLEIDHLLQDIRVRFGDDFQLPEESDWQAIDDERVEAKADSLEAYIAELQSEADALRRRLEREGDVDPESIEAYQRESQRLDEMTRQHTDLTKAAHTLERVIATLKEVSRERFVETFNFVNEKFQELVPRLFGGGAGHLELLNPEDPLTSGVDITVRPPGKKLRSLELLSGGEKALSAAALIVAMFLYKPSPLCVLDEVDAPLDDANLDRFLDLVKEIAKTTQFLVITHNKQSMAEMHRLLGITMQERGVSTALSVSLEDAYIHAEPGAALPN